MKKIQGKKTKKQKETKQVAASYCSLSCYTLEMEGSSKYNLGDTWNKSMSSKPKSEKREKSSNNSHQQS